MLTRTDIEKYFLAEKSESLVFLLVGMIAIGFAVYAYAYPRSNLIRGAAIPILIVGLIQSVVGYSVYSRSDRQRVECVYAYDMDPARLRNEELPRMVEVNRRFQVYRWAEIGLLFAGIMMVILYWRGIAGKWYLGCALGVILQSAFMLGADYFAERRAAEYTRLLQDFVQRKTTSGI